MRGGACDARQTSSEEYGGKSTTLCIQSEGVWKVWWGY